MDIKSFILEIIELIKKEKLTILLTAIIVTILAIAVQVLAVYDFGSEDDTEDAVSVPAKLDMYIEQENIGAFSNSYLMEILATDPEVVREVSEASNVDIETVLETYAENNDIIYTTEDPINIERNTSSNVMMMTINVGSNEENLAVANAYENWFENTTAPFFEDKEVFLISDPELSGNIPVNSDNNSLSMRTVMIRSVLGLLLGVLVGMVIAILKAILNDKIKYSFTYGWNTNDIHIKETKSASAAKAAHDILSSQVNSIAIVSEKSLSNELLKELNSNNSRSYNIYDNIANISLDNKVDEFVLVIERNETTKDWYSKQRNDLKLYPNSRVKIVEI